MTHPMPEINNLLKQVRLLHVMEQLPLRNRESIERKLAYPEFLSLIIQDEILGRENKKLTARCKRAGIKYNKTLESFDFDFNSKINRAQIQEAATCRFMDNHEPILIVGPCGTGKSHIAQAIAHCVIQRGIDVLWMPQSKLFSELQAAKAFGRYEKKMAELVKVPLLIIDDFGLRPMRNPQDEDFHDLISERYERASTIVTSNLDFSEWGSAFPNQLLAAATLDRLRHNAHKIVLEGASFRGSGSANTIDSRSTYLKEQKIGIESR